ncbi:MAG: V-type ATP synthase subunit D [Firmicutes bacterium]|nr:V-type ATP synthase subunit D [Bacillota bacterium]
MEIRVNPNRMELTRLKKRLATAVRGHKLLKDKLDELMKDFFDLVEENRNLRRQVEENLDTALGGLAMARAVISRSVLEAAITTSRGEAALQARTVSRMGVEVPLFQLAMTPALGNGFGMTETSAEFDEAIDLLANSFQTMIELAQVEKTVELMAAEIERTRRRVNALEYVLIPQLRTQIKYITMKLEENERANLVRLMKVKDIVRNR